MARRDLTGAVDFEYLEGFAAGDVTVIEEVLELFRQQAALWSGMLDPSFEGWRDAVHTIKGAARGVGAFAVGEAAAAAEPIDPTLYKDRAIEVIETLRVEGEAVQAFIEEYLAA